MIIITVMRELINNNSAKCKYCGETIMFLQSKKGKFYPVDTAVFNGEIVVLRGSKTGMPQFHNCKAKIFGLVG